MATIEDFQKLDTDEAGESRLDSAQQNNATGIAPWAKSAIEDGKMAEKELEIYNLIAEQHKEITKKLKGNADEQEAADQAFLRHIFNEMGVKHGLSEGAVRNIYYRLQLLSVNYRPPSNIDFSEEAINQNMPKYLEYYRAHRNQLIMAAAWNRKHAVSYRKKPFKIGCAALTLDPDLQDGEYAVNQAHNFTPLKGNWKGREKRCAERNAIDGAISHKTKLIIAVVIVSKEKDKGDDESKSCTVLHPCLECRKMYRELLEKGLLRTDSVICSANDSEFDEKGMPSVIEEMSVEELMKLYEDDPKE